jgi:hypothetical protein
MARATQQSNKSERRWPPASDSKVEVTTIERGTIWHGTANGEAKSYLWYYEPRRFLHLMEQDARNPRCWMYVEPPDGFRQIVLKAIRSARHLK